MGQWANNNLLDVIFSFRLLADDIKGKQLKKYCSKMLQGLWNKQSLRMDFFTIFFSQFLFFLYFSPKDCMHSEAPVICGQGQRSKTRSKKQV